MIDSLKRNNGMTLTSSRSHAPGALAPSWGNLNLAVLDVETTGLYPSCGDRICEVAVLRIEGGEERPSFSTLVDPGRPLSPGARRVNTISEQELAGAPCFEEVAQRLEDALSGAVIVGHNAPFDLRFVRSEFARLGRSLPVDRVIDTLALARKAYTFPGYALGTIARSLGFQPSGLHRALADARTTWLVLKRFWQELAAQGFSEVDQLIELSRGVEVPTLPKGLAPEAEDLEAVPYPIVGALRDGTRLRVTVEASERGRTTRVVTPRRIERRSDYYYLCVDGPPEGALRLDRIVELTIVREAA